MNPGAQRLEAVLERIGKAARSAGRNPQDITLVGVTKTVPFEGVHALVQAGLAHMGENRVQEASGKYVGPDGLRRCPGILHLIGPLQRNKARKAVELFDMIQSLDRLDLADDLNRHAQSLGKTLPCLVEVKISPEDSKSGVAPDHLFDFLSHLAAYEKLSIKGLMGIAPRDATSDAARPFFARLRQLFEKSSLGTLSMGMSGDFESAIAEGSTMVRIGTALFGSRG